MKNIRPFGAICIVHPGGRPASRLFVACELSLVVDVSSLELCLDWPVPVVAAALAARAAADAVGNDDVPLSAASTSSFWHCFSCEYK